MIPLSSLNSTILVKHAATTGQTNTSTALLSVQLQRTYNLNKIGQSQKSELPKCLFSSDVFPGVVIVVATAA